MNRIKHWFVVAAFLVGAPACMSTPEGESASLDGQEPSGADSAQPLQQWNMESAQLDKNTSDISAATDCAFIEWCNRPASISPDIGTVCRIRTGCSLTSATVTECTNDARAVCGGMVQPAWICRQGFVCPPG